MVYARIPFENLQVFLPLMAPDDCDAIFTGAGHFLQHQCAMKGGCKVGKLVVTDGFDLPAAVSITLPRATVSLPTAPATATPLAAGGLRMRTVTEASAPERLDIVLSATERAEFDTPTPAAPRMRSRVERPLVPPPSPPVVPPPPVSERSRSGREQPSHVHSDDERRRPQERSRSPRSRRHSRSPPRSERRGRSTSRPVARPRSPLRAERRQHSPPRSRARSQSPHPKGRESGDSRSSRRTLH